MKILKNMILVISIIAFMFQLYVDINPSISLGVEGRIIIAFIQVIGFITVYLLSRNVSLEKRRIYFKWLIWILFIIYLINLFYLLFLDGEMGRDFHVIENLDNILSDINLKPFSTIQLYINSYYGHYLPLSLIVMNLLGNFVAFMPMAIFLPMLFKSQRNCFVYFITNSLMIIGVELLQVMTMSGRGDIDDYILNIAGSMFMFVIVSIFRKGIKV